MSSVDNPVFDRCDLCLRKSRFGWWHLAGPDPMDHLARLQIAGDDRWNFRITTCQGMFPRIESKPTLFLLAMAAETVLAQLDDRAVRAEMATLRAREAACAASDDLREGLAAFAERRTPRFSGR